jgi:hypothetical protein
MGERQGIATLERQRAADEMAEGSAQDSTDEVARVQALWRGILHPQERVESTEATALLIVMCHEGDSAQEAQARSQVV